VFERLKLQRCLREQCIEVSDASASRDRLFAAEADITGAAFLVAETGSVVLLTAPEAPRSVSLLPPLHIAVAECGQLVPDLFDVFERQVSNAEMRACLTLITGPNKTGDIELRLVTGVHERVKSTSS
jgi:L-lactate dehydrogenase complex protein LldG